MDFEIKINDQPLPLGATLAEVDLPGADFRRTGLLQRLLQKLPADVQKFEAENCTLSCFDDALEIYPCTHSYLTPDRQWRTQATVLARGDRLYKLLFQIVEGTYSAANFSERFAEVCRSILGEPEESDRLYARWRNDNLTVTQLLHPDRKNADIAIELDIER